MPLIEVTRNMFKGAKEMSGKKSKGKITKENIMPFL